MTKESRVEDAIGEWGRIPFERRRRERVKKAIESGALRIEINNKIMSIYYKGHFLGLVHTSHRGEVRLMISVIKNIIDGFLVKPI